METVLVLAALGFEVGRLACTMAGQPVQFVVTGPGPDRALIGIKRALVRHRPARIMAIGLCGGLRPGDNVGTVAYPEVIHHHTESGPVPCQPWDDLVPKGVMLTVDRIAATPRTKAQLRSQSGADWVDTETYVWAREAERHGIPFNAMRVVVDAWCDYIPHWRDPQSWPGVVSLPQKSFRARRILHRHARGILCACS